MDLIAITELISKLENEEVSLSNVRNLSALYTVKDHISNDKQRDETTKELHDILPSYIKYVEIKRKYQMGETTNIQVFAYLNVLCKEIFDFMQVLYNNTDMPQERELLETLIKRLCTIY